MKVLLLSLPGFEENDGDLFPLGIGYLVGALQNDHDVRARHYQSMMQAKAEVHGLLLSFRPDVVGFTCSTFNRGPVREMMRIIRGADPGVKIIAGGVHASFCWEQVLKEYGADVVVIGEGERTFCELCGAMARGGSLEDVTGIAYLEDGQVRVTAPRPTVHDLDELALPDYSYAAPFIERSEMGFLITSRGCPVRCTFCSTSSFWGQRVRMHSVARVVDEMEGLIELFGVKRIFFHDDTFNLGVARVKAVCSEIMERGIKVEWGCSCRVTPVSEEMIAAMVEAGCRHICWGIESGSADMLQRINKKISLEQIRHAYDLCRKVSPVLSTGAFTMVGNQGESQATVDETVAFLNTIPITDAPSTSILYILPGTLLYEELKVQGKIAESDWTRYDTVPYYTLENSYGDLARWVKSVQASGVRIPFDRTRHFWSGAPEISEGKDASGSLLCRIRRGLLDPKKVRSIMVRALPAGKIRF